MLAEPQKEAYDPHSSEALLKCIKYQSRQWKRLEDCINTLRGPGSAPLTVSNIRRGHHIIRADVNERQVVHARDCWVHVGDREYRAFVDALTPTGKERPIGLAQVVKTSNIQQAPLVMSPVEMGFKAFAKEIHTINSIQSDSKSQTADKIYFILQRPSETARIWSLHQYCTNSACAGRRVFIENVTTLSIIHLLERWIDPNWNLDVNVGNEGADSSLSPSSSWICPSCTFVNGDIWKRCSMCNCAAPTSWRPRTANPSASSQSTALIPYVDARDAKSKSDTKDAKAQSVTKDSDTKMASSSAPFKNSNTWECKTCTYNNTVSNSLCEMCTNPRGYSNPLLDSNPGCSNAKCKPGFPCMNCVRPTQQQQQLSCRYCRTTCDAQMMEYHLQNCPNYMLRNAGLSEPSGFDLETAHSAENEPFSFGNDSKSFESKVASSSSSSASASDARWTCMQCTLVNSKDAWKCEVCGWAFGMNGRTVYGPEPLPAHKPLQPNPPSALSAPSLHQQIDRDSQERERTSRKKIEIPKENAAPAFCDSPTPVNAAYVGHK